MQYLSLFFQKLASAFPVGSFLAVREIKRSNKWTTALIIFIMTLTFLNLVVVRGFLVGLVVGADNNYRTRYYGDIIIDSLSSKNYIDQTPSAITTITGLPDLWSYSPRYIFPAQVESGYKTKINQSYASESVNAIATGIGIKQELATTHLDRYIVKGRFINESDVDTIVVGASLLNKYTPIDTATLKTLKTADVGSKVLLRINGYQREVTIVGILKTKVDVVDLRIYMPASVLRSMIGRSDNNVNEIAITLKHSDKSNSAKSYLLANGVGKIARIRTFNEVIPKYVQDVTTTFEILSDILGSIVLVVAAVSIFIIIFVNAVTRRKYIGILKGIGVTAWSIEISYILQALFYAAVGIGLGNILIFAILKPYFALNPIDFPFGNGVLVADPPDVLIRSVILFLCTIVSGYIPSRLIVKQNTVDAILGR